MGFIFSIAIEKSQEKDLIAKNVAAIGNFMLNQENKRVTEPIFSTEIKAMPNQIKTSFFLS